MYQRFIYCLGNFTICYHTNSGITFCLARVLFFASILKPLPFYPLFQLFRVSGSNAEELVTLSPSAFTVGLLPFACIFSRYRRFGSSEGSSCIRDEASTRATVSISELRSSCMRLVGGFFVDHAHLRNYSRPKFSRFGFGAILDLISPSAIRGHPQNKFFFKICARKT